MNNIINFNEIMYIECLDHHNENYTGIEGCYKGMDNNDYLIEKSLNNLENNYD